MFKPARSPVRFLAPLWIAVLASHADAQFDNAWAGFAPDASRLKTATGQAATYLMTNTLEKDLAWGDLDRDGWTDLIIVTFPGQSGGSVNYLLMNEYGTLVDRTARYAVATDVSGDNGFQTPTRTRDVIVVDLNLDGWLDVVTSTSSSVETTPPYLQPMWLQHVTHPRVYMNLGVDANGSWLGLRYESSRIPQLYLASNPRAFNGVAVGDVTGDGYPDLYLCGDFILSDKLLINDGTGVFTDSGNTRLTDLMLYGPLGSTARIVDMNGDGVSDIVRCTTYTGPQQVSIAYNDPAQIGYFPQVLFQASVGTQYANYVDVGDLNRDGKPDLVISTDGNDVVRYNTGLDALGRAIFGPAVPYLQLVDGPDGFSGSMRVVDLDGDGWSEVIQANVDFTAMECSTERCRIYHNPGGPAGSPIVLREEAGSLTGTWRGVVGITANDLRGMWDTAVFDLDNDGDLDFVFARCSGMFVWMNRRHQGLAPKSFCVGDGGGSNCPCSNKGGQGRGCANSNSAVGARLTIAGVASISSDTLRLTSTGGYHGAGIFIQGSTPVNGGNGVGFGDGLLCVTGTVIRLGIDLGAGSESTYPSGTGGPSSVPISVKGGAVAGNSLHHQFIYRDSNPTYCTPSTFNSTNGVTVTWIP